MVLYHSELDKDLFLPIVVKNVSSDDITVPEKFLEKYNILFLLIYAFKCDLLGYYHVQRELTFSRNCEDINIKVMAEKYKVNIDILNKMSLNFDEVINVADLYKYLHLWGEICDILYNLGIYKVEHSKFLEVMQLFNDSLVELADLQKMIKFVELPNTWFITKNGCLYNNNNACYIEGNMQSIYKEYNENFINGFMGFKPGKVSNKQSVDDFINSGYLTDIALDVFLNYKDYIKFNKKSFDLKFFKIIEGLLAMRKDYYDFLFCLVENMEDPVDELNKIIELTNGCYEDVLVRCCGASKINSGLKIIVTSCLDYETRFLEYIDKGYSISFIPPIVVNKEKGIVEEFREDFFKVKNFRKY